MRGSSGDEMLPTVVHRLLPTPTVNDSRGGLVATATRTNPDNKHHAGRTLTDVIYSMDLDAIDWQEYEPAIRQWERLFGRPVPFPAALGPRSGIKPAPAFVEWMMGLPAGHVSTVPDLSINDRLKLLGNGVVPPQAEHAIRILTNDSRHEMRKQMNDTSGFFATHQTRDVPRDQWGRYKLPGPDGEDVSWTRATTFAATLAESYALQIWKQRQVVWGLSRRPDLITMASTIAGPEDKKALGEIVTEAHIAAGTDAKANRGTAIHRACQAAERGAWELVPEELRPHVQAYAQALNRGGLEMLPEYVERTVIVNRYQVAGTFDNLVRCPDGKIRVLDKKTGNLDYAALEFAIQLALYAHADAVFDYSSGRYERLPEIATDYAIIAHIDPETGATELQRVNIEWGWVWARTAAEVMDIRKTKHVITPFVPWSPGTADPAPEQSTQTEQPLPPPPPVIAEAAQIMHQVNANAAPVERPMIEYTDHNGYIVRASAGPLAPIDLSRMPAPVSAEIAQHGTMHGGFVDSTSSVLPEFQAFWSDDRHFTEAEEPAEQVNGVPVAEYGSALRWPCARNEPCEFTESSGLHSDGTVCLYGNARPGPIATPEHTPPSPTETAATVSEGASDDAVSIPVKPNTMYQIDENGLSEVGPAETIQPGDVDHPKSLAIDDAVTMPTVGVPDDAMVAKIGKLSKESGQLVARRLMERIGIAEGGPGSIKLKQYKTAVARDIVTLAFQHGMSIPHMSDDKPDFGIPTGPAPSDDAPAAGEKPDPAAQQRADAAMREAQVRTAVESIRMQGTIAGIQERHTYYSGTSLGWTDEMQNAARTRAAEIEQADGELPLTPMQMIQGATSKETLAKAYAKATSDGQDRSGWTPELHDAAQAKHAELYANAGVAASGNQ